MQHVVLNALSAWSFCEPCSTMEKRYLGCLRDFEQKRTLRIATATPSTHDNWKYIYHICMSLWYCLDYLKIMWFNINIWASDDPASEHWSSKDLRQTHKCETSWSNSNNWFQRLLVPVRQDIASGGGLASSSVVNAYYLNRSAFWFVFRKHGLLFQLILHKHGPPFAL